MQFTVAVGSRQRWLPSLCMIHIIPGLFLLSQCKKKKAGLPICSAAVVDAEDSQDRYLNHVGVWSEPRETKSSHIQL